MNNLDKQYLDLLRDIKETGHRKEGRNGITYSILGRTIRHDMREGFPLITTKKMWWKGIVTELLWFLSGSTNIQSLVKQGNHIWVGDAYKYYVNNVEDNFKSTYVYFKNATNTEYNYRVFTEKEFIEKIKNDDEFAKKWGDMGRIYGAQWRDWDNDGIDNYEELLLNRKGRLDQIEILIDTLIHNPDSRRMRVSAWNVGELDDMKLPPCHYGFTVSTRELTLEERISVDTNEFKLDAGEYLQEYSEKELHRELDKLGVPRRGISLIFSMRSTDVGLGLPFNLASYGLLLFMLAQEVNMLPLELIYNGEDVHIYENHLEGIEEQLKRNSHPLPTVIVRDGIYSNWGDDIQLKNYVSEDKIQFPLSN